MFVVFIILVFVVDKVFSNFMIALVLFISLNVMFSWWEMREREVSKTKNDFWKVILHKLPQRSRDNLLHQEKRNRQTGDLSKTIRDLWVICLIRSLRRVFSPERNPKAVWNSGARRTRM